MGRDLDPQAESPAGSLGGGRAGARCHPPQRGSGCSRARLGPRHGDAVTSPGTAAMPGRLGKSRDRREPRWLPPSSRLVYGLNCSLGSGTSVGAAASLLTLGVSRGGFAAECHLAGLFPAPPGK